MTLSSRNIKKCLTLYQKKTFFILPEIKPFTFQSKLDKEKKFTLGKFVILQETKTLKKLFVLSQKKAFFKVQETGSPMVICKA